MGEKKSHTWRPQERVRPKIAFLNGKIYGQCVLDCTEPRVAVMQIIVTLDNVTKAT